MLADPYSVLVDRVLREPSHAHAIDTHAGRDAPRHTDQRAAEAQLEVGGCGGRAAAAPVEAGEAVPLAAV